MIAKLIFLFILYLIRFLSQPNIFFIRTCALFYSVGIGFVDGRLERDILLHDPANIRILPSEFPFKNAAFGDLVSVKELTLHQNKMSDSLYLTSLT